MSVPTYDEARRLLNPDREGRLFRAILTAWDDWHDCPARGDYSRWPRTRANMVFERVAARLQEEFGSDTGVQCVFMDETIKVVIEDSIVLRVKKANALGLGQNIQTQAVLDFVDAQPDLPGMSGLGKLEVVYVLNDLQTRIAAVQVHARDGEMKLYSYAIGAASEGATILPFPSPSRGPDTSGSYADDLVRPKLPEFGDTGADQKPG